MPSHLRPLLRLAPPPTAIRPPSRHRPFELFFRLALALAVWCGVSETVSAATANSAPARRPKIALVLSGGSARGAAHVGVLQVLEENRVPIDVIAGTSMGAIVGGMYASGMSPEEMARTLNSTDWNDLFNDRPSRQHRSFRRKQEDMESLAQVEIGWDHGLALPNSLIAGDKLIFYLRQLTLHTYGVTDFDRLPIPFRAVATDLENGARVVLDAGNLAEAMRASMAIPGAFAPQEIDGRLLVDGLLTENLPVSVARQLGADIIIAVDVGSPLTDRSELRSLLQITRQAFNIMGQSSTLEQIAQLRSGDLLIQPDLGTIGGLSFQRSPEAIARGAEAAREKHAQLQRLALSEEAYARWQAGQRRPIATSLRIDRVRIDHGGHVANATIEKRAGLEPGRETSVAAVRRSLERIYDLGAFDVVDFSLTENEGQNELVIRPRERSNGTIRVRGGLSLFSDLDGDSDFNFLTSVTATEMNQPGAEWKSQLQFGRTTRAFTEWYQPIDSSRAFFWAARGQFTQDRAEGFSADGQFFRAKFRRFEAGADAGLQLGNHGELRFGPAWGRTKAHEMIGFSLPGGATSITQAGARLGLIVDQLDNTNFPRHGHVGGFEIFSSRRALGADLDYTRVSGNWNHAFSFGANTLLGGLSFGGKIGPDLPFYETSSLGGFLNLSGLPYESLSDQYSGLARLIYFRRVAGSGGRLLSAVYLGGSLEAGGVWHTLRQMGTREVVLAGSVFAGMDTLFGPLYLAYGQAERGSHAFYFYLGRGF